MRLPRPRIAPALDRDEYLLGAASVRDDLSEVRTLIARAASPADPFAARSHRSGRPVVGRGRLPDRTPKEAPRGGIGGGCPVSTHAERAAGVLRCAADHSG